MTCIQRTCFLLVTTLTGFANAKFDPIAFTVALDSHRNYTDLTTVPYNHIITSHMHRNEITNGVFTCTEGGTFKCQFYSMAFTSGTTFLDIWHNERRIASLYGHIENGTAFGGNAVVLTLSEGDTVQVKTRMHRFISLFGYEYYNTFTCSEVGSEALSQNRSFLSAFSVASDRNQIVYDGGSVMYNVKLTDTDNAFNSKTGIYIVPVSGIYIFHFFGLPMQNEELWQDLYINNNYTCSIRCKTNFEWSSAGNTVVLHVNKNDSVIVRARVGFDNYLLGQPDQLFTTFSGIRLVTDIDAQSPDMYPVVAFSVGLATNLTVQSHGNLTFDKVFVNYKHAFSLSSGVFVAPVSGVYEFNFHFRGRLPNEPIYLKLMHNTRAVNGIYSLVPGQHATAGNAVVLNLKGGDHVWIMTKGNNSLYGDPFEIYCTFSGYLLHSISPAEIIVGK